MTHTHILRNPLADPLKPTPSASDSIPPELERELRLYGGLLIQQAGILLKLPQIVMATAATLFQRFYFVTSFLHFGIRDVSAGSLFLAAKLEEKPARVRDIINVYDYLLQLIDSSRPPTTASAAEGARVAEALASQAAQAAQARIELNPLLPPEIKASMLRHLEQKRLDGSAAQQAHSTKRVETDDGPSENPRPDQINKFRYIPMDYFAKRFYDRKEEIVVAEMQILKRLGFHVQVQHPYSAMVNYLQVLNLTDNLELSQRAWCYLNDSLLTPLPALYPPTHLATLAIYLAAADRAVDLPEAWWELFDISEADELERMADVLTAIYPKVSSERDSSAQNQSTGQPVASIWRRVSQLPVTKEAIRELVKERAL